MNIVKNDFIEIAFTGYSEGKVFDSNIKEDMTNLPAKGNAQPAKLIVGQRMVVSGLDIALEGKQIGQEFKVDLKPEQAFGERKKDLVRLIPLKAFHEKGVDPKSGAIYALDDVLVRIVTVSGGRVIADFNNPLAGKNVSYKVKIVKKIEDEKEKVELVLTQLFRFVPKYELGERVTIIGPQFMESFTKALNETFHKLIGKNLAFKLEEKPVATEKQDKKAGQ